MSYVKDLEIKDIVEASLKEDIGSRDITTETLIPSGKKIKAVILAKENFVVCGLNVAASVFMALDRDIKFKPLVREGDSVRKGEYLAMISGKARSILTAERVALNFLCLLCGISTKTRKYVKAVKPYKVKVLDTRKTLPALRLLEKYAVRIGGGFNHRMSLDEMILVKDNHLKCIGGINKLTALQRKYKKEIEVKDLRELSRALRLNPDIIMLDNMNFKEMKKAVLMRNKTAPGTKLEASGGISLKNIRKAASSGVDMVSIGDLTSSVESVDISLEVL